MTYTNPAFIDHIDQPLLQDFIYVIHQQSDRFFSRSNHGDFIHWSAGLERLLQIMPVIPHVDYDLNDAEVRVGKPEELVVENRQAFERALMQFHPWRKGPYRLFGVGIDSEWRSDMKWARLAGHISKLDERTVLDIGCGNGYHCWRMLGAGAKAVLGIDPMLQYVMQFKIFHNYLPLPNIELLPVGIEALPEKLAVFDTVFSMGVLYHRRSPLDHLLRLKDLLSPGGELVLETLVVDGVDGFALLPAGRYARMRNVWFLPSTLSLESWLKRCGYKNIRLVDVSYTTTSEQRATRWMTYDSLDKCLNPKDSFQTVENYPAPKRAIFSCSI